MMLALAVRSLLEQRQKNALDHAVRTAKWTITNQSEKSESRKTIN